MSESENTLDFLKTIQKLSTSGQKITPLKFFVIYLEDKTNNYSHIHKRKQNLRHNHVVLCPLATGHPQLREVPQHEHLRETARSKFLAVLEFTTSGSAGPDLSPLTTALPGWGTPHEPRYQMHSLSRAHQHGWPENPTQL